MVRILVLKRLYNLSDEQMEYPLLDRMSYKRFCALALAANMPDRTTVWVFEHRIGEVGAKAIFDGVTAQLLKKGLIARGGQIIDATLAPAPKQRFTKGDKEMLKEEAMPADGSPAKRRKFIRKIVNDTASAHDSQRFEAVMDPANARRDVYADRGDPSEEREAWLKANGYRNRIERKGHRNKPLSEAKQRRNPRIANTRARVEHVFAAIAQMGGKLIRAIGQARANFAMTRMAACYDLKRLAYFQRAGVVPA